MLNLFKKPDPIETAQEAFRIRFGLSENNTALCQRAFMDGWLAAIAGLELDRTVKSFGLDEPILETFVERGWVQPRALNKKGGDRP